MDSHHSTRRDLLTATVATGLSLPGLAKQSTACQHPACYPDPNIKSLDPRFDRYMLKNTSIQRLYTSPQRISPAEQPHQRQ